MKKATALLSAAAAVLLSASPALPADWPMFLKDGVHSSYAQSSPQAPYALKWKFATKGPVYSSPVISKNKLYAGSYDKNLYALDAATGKLLWSFSAEGEILSTPAVDADSVYFGSKDGKVYALDAATGKLKWSYKTEGTVLTSPLVQNGTVFIGSNDLYMYALSSADGKRLWRSKFLDTPFYGAIYSSPAFYEGAVLAAGKNGMIYSLDTKSGARNWSKKTLSSIYASPAVRDGILYISSYDRKLFALNAATGKNVWIRSLKEAFSYSSPVVDKDVVYLALGDGHIKIYDREKGAARGDFRLPAGTYSTPALTSSGNLIIGCEDGGVYVLDVRTGAVLWKYFTGASVHSSPAVLDDAVYVGSEDGGVYAFGPQDK